jgi:hypothetical protein
VVQEDVIKHAVKDGGATVELSTNGDAGKWLGDCMGRYDQLEGDVMKFRQRNTVSNTAYQLSR